MHSGLQVPSPLWVEAVDVWNWFEETWEILPDCPAMAGVDVTSSGRRPVRFVHWAFRLAEGARPADVNR
jgi:hypothetical protein